MDFLRRYFLPSMSSVALVLSLSSCFSPPPRFETVEMAEQEDIPVPKNFELRHSYSPKAAVDLNFRSWVGEYVGQQQLGVIVPWYINEMRDHRWQILRVEDTGNEGKKLYFEKDEEVSTVECTRSLDSEHAGFLTHVHIRVGPRGPEDFTVAEHLQRKEAGFRPVSLRKEDDETPYHIENAIESGSVRVTKKGTNTGDVEGGPEDETQLQKAAGKKQDGGALEDDAVEAKPRARKPEKTAPPAPPRKSASKGGSDLKEIQEFEEASH